MVKIVRKFREKSKLLVIPNRVTETLTPNGRSCELPPSGVRFRQESESIARKRPYKRVTWADGKVHGNWVYETDRDGPAHFCERVVESGSDRKVPGRQESIAYEANSLDDGLTHNDCTHHTLNAYWKVGKTAKLHQVYGTSVRKRTVLVYTAVMPRPMIEAAEDMFRRYRRAEFKNVTGYPVTYSDFVNKVLNPHENEIGVSVAEVAMVASSIKSVTSGFKQLPKLLKRVRPFMKRILAGLKGRRSRIRYAKALSQEAANAHLAYQFGFKQTGEDVARIVAFTPSVIEHLRKLSEKNGEILRRRFGSRDVSYKTSIVNGYRYEKRIETINGVTVVARFTLPGLTDVGTAISQMRAALKAAEAVKEYYGLNPSLKRTWNIVPLSFLVDRIIPIGDFLETFEARKLGARVSLKRAHATLVVKAETKITHIESGATVILRRRSFYRSRAELDLTSLRSSELQLHPTDVSLIVQRA